VKIECKDHWHDVSPTGLALIVQAFQQGDLQWVMRTNSGVTIEWMCITVAFTNERVKDFQSRYHGHTISVDGKTYERESSNGKAQ